MKPSARETTSDRKDATRRRREGSFVGSPSTTSNVAENLVEPSHRSSRRSSPRRKLLRRILISAVALSVVAATLYWVARGATQGPAFYRIALDQSPAQAYVHGEAFEQSLAQWHNELHAKGDWQLVVDDEQLNGWLGAHLPEKFPSSLPSEVSNPRCSITKETTQLAFQVHWKNRTFVIATTVEFFLTDEPNVLAAKLKGVRSGIIPLPISEWLGSAADTAAGAGVKVRWTQDQGSPLALITIPDTVPNDDDLTLVLRGVEQRDGELVLSGYTRQRSADSATSPLDSSDDAPSH